MITLQVMITQSLVQKSLCHEVFQTWEYPQGVACSCLLAGTDTLTIAHYGWGLRGNAHLKCVAGHVHNFLIPFLIGSLRGLSAAPPLLELPPSGGAVREGQGLPARACTCRSLCLIVLVTPDSFQPSSLSYTGHTSPYVRVCRHLTHAWRGY